MTDTGIKMLDMYLLSYCGIKVIFQVCDTTDSTVTLIELATKKYKDGITLTKKYKSTKKPLIIKGNNTFTGSNFFVSAIREDKKLPIRIDITTKIFWEAQKYTDYPPMGTFLAVPFPDHRDTYWKKPKEKERKEWNTIKSA